MTAESTESALANPLPDRSHRIRLVAERETIHRLGSAIRGILRGPEAEPKPTPRDSDLAQLSDREFQVFHFLGLGRSTRQTAEALRISIKTVQVHCGNIRQKLGLRTGTELLSAAIRWNHCQETGL